MSYVTDIQDAPTTSQPMDMGMVTDIQDVEVPPEESTVSSWANAIKPVPALIASGFVDAAAGAADLVGAKGTADKWRQDTAAVNRQVEVP
jgi:hypothetical protein